MTGGEAYFAFGGALSQFVDSVQPQRYVFSVLNGETRHFLPRPLGVNVPICAIYSAENVFEFLTKSHCPSIPAAAPPVRVGRRLFAFQGLPRAASIMAW